MIWTNGVATLHHADARDIPLADESVHCVVASPPYWGLRSYGLGDWQGGDAACQHQSRASSPQARISNGKFSAESPNVCPNNTCGLCGAVQTPAGIGLEPTLAVPAHDKEGSARFFARIFGLEYTGPLSHFAPVQVNDSLTLDFDDGPDGFQSHHLAFKVTDEEFDGVVERVKAEGIPYGSGPFSRTDMRLNHRRGGRGLYFEDPNGHVLETFTR